MKNNENSNPSNGERKFGFNFFPLKYKVTKN